jgi:hypothetical protein
MNKELQELNRIGKRNALAEKMLLAMIPNAQFWDIHFDDKNRLLKPDEVMETCFNMADKFIKYSETGECDDR